MPSDELRELLRDALGHLYDPVHLQSHPLLGQLNLEPLAGESQPEALRRVLRDAVRALQPPAEVPPTSSEWIPYRVLWSHYVRGLPVNRICEDLGLSRASFFRRQNDALEAVATVLTGKWGVGASSEADSAASEQEAIERTLDLTAAMPRETIALDDVMRGVLHTLAPLAKQRQVVLAIQVGEAIPPAYAAPAILRQVLLGILTRALGLLHADRLQIAISSRDREISWRMRSVRQPEALRSLCDKVRASDVSQRMLGLCQGRVRCIQEPWGPSVMLSLAVVRPRAVVLVIDDDPQTIALYRGYLASDQCNVVGARSFSEAKQLLSRMTPSIIVLDVILPGEDGWAILRSLRDDPGTASVPILLSSVVETPDLGLALGASAVLTKPVGKQELHETMDRFLAREDSSE